eukprot:m.236527 g.236527  ORF g.236527 m.236527 type:complete len:313 (-) comp13922_c0_seq9:9567-10505(-)
MLLCVVCLISPFSFLPVNIFLVFFLGVTTEESHMNMEDFDAVLDEIVDEIDAGDLMHISSSSCAPTVTKLVLCEADPVALKVVQQNIDDLLAEESGECVYTIGTSEDELPGITKEEMGTSLKTLTTICDEIGADVVQLRTSDADEGLVSDCLVRKRLLPSEFSEVRVAVVGNVDAGKSTLLGVLTHGVMDNGRGLSRKQLFRHQHEMDSGRTSSVSYDIMGFDSKGSIVNNPGHDGRLDWVQICQDAAKVLTFIDLAGHEKYLKTTVYGLTGCSTLCHAHDWRKRRDCWNDKRASWTCTCFECSSLCGCHKD